MNKLQLVTSQNIAELERQDETKRLIALADALIVLTGSTGNAFGLFERLTSKRKVPEVFLENGKRAFWRERIVEDEIIRQAKASGDYYKRGSR